MTSTNEKHTVNRGISEDIRAYVKKLDDKTPIRPKDLLELFPHGNDGSIRLALQRLYFDGVLSKPKPGVYYKVVQDASLRGITKKQEEIVENRYMIDMNRRIGYRSGGNFASQLNLAHTWHDVECVVSNNVTNGDNPHLICKGKVEVIAPRVEVTDRNYKFLQVMDIMNDYEKLCDVSLKDAAPVLRQYLINLKLSSREIDHIVSAYSLDAQVNLYKSGIYREIIK